MKIKTRSYMYVVGMLNCSTVKQVRWWHTIFPCQGELKRITTRNSLSDAESLMDAVIKLRELGYSRHIMNMPW